MTDYNALQCEAAAYARANAAEERARQLEAELERVRRELAEFTGAALCALGVNRDESVSPGNQVIAAIIDLRAKATRPAVLTAPVEVR